MMATPKKPGDARLSTTVLNPVAKAVASKLVLDVNAGRFTRPTSGGERIPGTDVLGRISQATSQSMTDASNILETQPDIERAMTIMVSGILSPSDLRSPKPSFVVDDTSLDASLTANLLTIIQEHFTKEYRIETWFPDALEDALFKTGSYPLMIVPENSLDDIINNRSASLESVKTVLDSNSVPKSIGLLGPGLSAGGKKKKSTAQPGLESWMSYGGAPAEIDSRITKDLLVTDNFAALKMPTLVDRFRKQRAISAIWQGSGMKASMEAANVPINKVSDAIFHRNNFRMREVVRIKPSDMGTRAPIGHPLVMKLPSDAYIPVHVPSNPKDHLGGFVLLDEFGYPLSNATESTYYRDLTNAMQANRESSEASKMLAQSRYFQSGQTCPADNRTLRALSQSYADIVEKDLLERLKNGYHGQAVDIARPEEVYRIMFARALAGRQTMLLYVPAELVTYIAFDYNQVGIGRSLLDKTKILASIRATLLFANTMAAIKNSTARQILNIELEETDDDPESTVEYLVTEHMRLQSGSKLAATTSPLDIVTNIQRANVAVAVTGNPHYPETKVGVEDAQSQRAAIDNDFSKSITDQIWMSFGLAPEIIDDMGRIEFAASQITSNALMTKTFAFYQEQFCNFVSDFVHKYVMNSGKLMGAMILEIRKYRKELKDSGRVKDVSELQDSVDAIATIAVDDDSPTYAVKEQDENVQLELEGSVFEIIGEFINAIRVQLPPPDDNRIEAQAEAFNSYSEFLTAVIEARLSDDVLDSILGEAAAEDKNAIRATVKAMYQRRYLIRNNVLPELEELKVREGEEEGEGIVGEHLSHVGDLSVGLSLLLKKIKETNVARENASGLTEGDSTSSGGDYESSSTDAPPDDGFSADASDGMGDELDFDLPE